MTVDLNAFLFCMLKFSVYILMSFFYLFSFIVTLITARNMCRGWHSALLAAWAPQKCAETLRERWKSSSKLPTPILGRRYLGNFWILCYGLKLETDGYIWIYWNISGILDGLDWAGWIFSQCARQIEVQTPRLALARMCVRLWKTSLQQARQLFLFWYSLP